MKDGKGVFEKPVEGNIEEQEHRTLVGLMTGILLSFTLFALFCQILYSIVQVGMFFMLVVESYCTNMQYRLSVK